VTNSWPKTISGVTINQRIFLQLLLRNQEFPRINIKQIRDLISPNRKSLEWLSDEEFFKVYPELSSKDTIE
jgi:hypothetical protein